MFYQVHQTIKEGRILYRDDHIDLGVLDLVLKDDILYAYEVTKEGSFPVSQMHRPKFSMSWEGYIVVDGSQPVNWASPNDSNTRWETQCWVLSTVKQFFTKKRGVKP